MKCPVFFLAAAICLLCNPAIAAQDAQGQKSVLLIYDTRSDMRSNVVVDQTFRKVLNEAFGVDLDIRSEYFEPPPSPDEDFPILSSWLRRKYSGRTFDVVVAVGATSLRFVRDYGDETFRGSQIVYWGRKAALEEWGSGSRLTGVVAPEMDSQVKGIFAFIRTLQPDLQRLVVITGTSPLDRAWETTARRVLKPFEGAVAVSYAAGLSLEDLETTVAKLQPRTAVLSLTTNEDGTGRRLIRTQFLSRLVQKAAVPVYSTSSLYLDTGIVGGALLNQEAMTFEAAGLVVRLLRGEDIGRMPIQESRLIPMVNWQALRRWRLNADRLPPGTTVMYKDPSAWEVYRWQIIGSISLILLEGGLIVALLVLRTGRRRAERATEQSKQLLQSTIDALNARVALLDEDGIIVAVNRRWQSFAEANGQGVTHNGDGLNYLEVSESGAQSEGTQRIADGIRRIKSGELEDFRCIYSSTQHGGVSWFQVRINRFDMYGALRFVVTCEDVTEIKEAHDAQQRLTGLLMRAQDEERRRIARELHDSTGQHLVMANLMAGQIQSQAPPSCGPAIADLKGILQGAISEIRTISYLLHPPVLEGGGLGMALQSYVHGFSSRTAIRIDLELFPDLGHMSSDVELVLFRVIQEALTNIWRHSGSKTARIRMVRQVSDGRPQITLSIEDAGRGIPNNIRLSTLSRSNSSPQIPSGLGLLGMRERLHLIGGRLEIDSTAGNTVIRAIVTLNPETEQEGA